MDHATSVVCICETHEQAQSAMHNLQGAGIDLGTLSLVTKDIFSELHDGEYYSAGDQTFTIPGIGSLLVNGPLAGWTATAMGNEAGAGGVSILGAALAQLGIPLDSVFQYETSLRAGKYLLLVHASPDAVAAALKVIGGTTHCSHSIHGEQVFDTVHGRSLLARPAYTYQA